MSRALSALSCTLSNCVQDCRSFSMFESKIRASPLQLPLQSLLNATSVCENNNLAALSMVLSVPEDNPDAPTMTRESKNDVSS